jgi:hypothetical protein
LQSRDNKEMRKCHLNSLAVLGFACTLLVSFQNFTTIPLERLKLLSFHPHLQAAWARNEGQGDIREIAPHRPASLDVSAIASPESGTDLESVGQDWARRQANLLTGGREEILLKEVNQKMNRAFRNFTESSTEESSGKIASRGPASIDRKSGTESGMREEENSGEPFLKFTSINRVQMMLPSEANVSCAVQGSSLQVDLSRSLGERVNVNLRHDTSSNSNTVRLHYTW